LLIIIITFSESVTEFPGFWSQCQS